MTISIYSNSLSKKNLTHRLLREDTPSECLKGFYLGTLNKKRGLVFLLGYFKDQVTKISIEGKFKYTKPLED